jgi:hypothetical protein
LLNNPSPPAKECLTQDGLNRYTFFEEGWDMVFRLVPKEEAQLFDDFMAGTPHGHIFQSFAWGEVKKPQWEPLRVIMEEEAES